MVVLNLLHCDFDRLFDCLFALLIFYHNFICFSSLRLLLGFNYQFSVLNRNFQCLFVIRRHFAFDFLSVYYCFDRNLFAFFTILEITVVSGAFVTAGFSQFPEFL